MEWDIPIYEQGELRGQLKVNRQGLRTIFQADCPAWDSGIKKVWLRGERGSLLLGTLVPEGNRLRLGRTISNAMLRERGWSAVTGRRLRERRGQNPSQNHHSLPRETVGFRRPAVAAGNGSGPGRGHPQPEKRCLAAGAGGNLCVLSLADRAADALYADFLFCVLFHPAGRYADLVFGRAGKSFDETGIKEKRGGKIRA